MTKLMAVVNQEKERSDPKPALGAEEGYAKPLRASRNIVTFDPPAQEAGGRFPDDWIRCFALYFKALRRAKLTGQQQDVLSLMMERAAFGNRVRMTQVAIAAELGLPKQRVSEALKRLLEADIVQCVRNADMPDRPAYRINPMLAYKGQASNWHRDRRANVIRGNFGAQNCD